MANREARRSVPVTITHNAVRELKEMQYSATIKMDGIRVGIRGAIDGVYIRHPSGSERKVVTRASIAEERSVPFMLDAEMMPGDGRVHVFDCLEYAGSEPDLAGRAGRLPVLSVRRRRMDAVVSMLRSLGPEFSFLECKEYFPCGSARDRWERHSEEGQHRADGIIFEPEDPSGQPYKWKPQDRHSVDLWCRLVTWDQSEVDLAVLVACPSRDGSPRERDESSAKEIRVRMSGEDAAGMEAEWSVVSLAIRPEGTPWEFECVRLDKPHANTLSTYLRCMDAYSNFVRLEDLARYLSDPDMSYDEYVAMVQAFHDASVVVGAAGDAAGGLSSYIPEAADCPPNYSKPFSFPGDFGPSSGYLSVPHFTPTFSAGPRDASDDGHARDAAVLSNICEWGEVCPEGGASPAKSAVCDLTVIVVLGRGRLFFRPSHYDYHPLSSRSGRMYAGLERSSPHRHVMESMRGRRIWTDGRGEAVACQRQPGSARDDPAAAAAAAAADAEALLGMARQQVDWDEFSLSRKEIASYLERASVESIQEGAPHLHKACFRAHQLVRSGPLDGSMNVCAYAVSRSALRCVRFVPGAGGVAIAYDVAARIGHCGPAAEHFDALSVRWRDYVRWRAACRQGKGRGKGKGKGKKDALDGAEYRALMPTTYDGPHVPAIRDHLNWFGYAPLDLSEATQGVIRRLAEEVLKGNDGTGSQAEVRVRRDTLLSAILAVHMNDVGGVLHGVYRSERARISREANTPAQYIRRSLVYSYDLGVTRGSIRGPYYSDGLLPIPRVAIGVLHPANRSSVDPDAPGWEESRNCFAFLMKGSFSRGNGGQRTGVSSGAGANADADAGEDADMAEWEGYSEEDMMVANEALRFLDSLDGEEEEEAERFAVAATSAVDEEQAAEQASSESRDAASRLISRAARAGLSGDAVAVAIRRIASRGDGDEEDADARRERREARYLSTVAEEEEDEDEDEEGEGEDEEDDGDEDGERAEELAEELVAGFQGDAEQALDFVKKHGVSGGKAEKSKRRRTRLVSNRGKDAGGRVDEEEDDDDELMS